MAADIIRTAWARLLDAVFPRHCPVCHGPSDRDGRHLCADCLSRLPFQATDGCCRICSRPVPGLTGDYLCQDCRGRHRPNFDKAVQALEFSGDARRLVHDFKFHHNFFLRDDLVDMLEGSLMAGLPVTEIDVVTAMPITLSHRWKRGYNQSELLAKPLSKRLDRSYRRLLNRVGFPRKQSSLSEAERWENPRGTFAAIHPEFIRGRTVLIVDDIMTTGATLSEAALTLKNAGARRVFAVTICRSVRF